MLWNRGVWYLGGALALAVLSVLLSHPVVRTLLAWCAVCFAYVGLGYLFSFSELLLKSRDGVVPLPIKVLLLPFFVFSEAGIQQLRVDAFQEPVRIQDILTRPPSEVALQAVGEVLQQYRHER